MPGENLGASFSIDVSQLRAGLAQANRLIRESESEFKAAAAGMDDWRKSEEGLTAKIKSLNDITSLQRTKVDALKTEYQNLINNGMDPTSKQAVDLRTKINNEQAALAKNEAELQKQTEALDDVRKAMEQAGDAADEAGDSLEEAGESAKDAGDGFTITKGAVADLIANGFTTLVGAAKNAISSLAGLAEETREFRQDMASLETAFDNVGFTADQATGVWRELYGVLGEDDRAVETANNISRMAKNQKDLNDWVDISTGIFGTYQDALPVEALAESAGETAKVGKVTGNLADALNWSSEAASMFAGYMGDDVTNAEDAFNVALSECSTEQERQALITDTLTKLYGGAADKYRETAESTIEANKATADYSMTQADLGETIEPVTNAVKKGFGEIIGKILELTGNTDLQGFADKVSSAFSVVTDTVLPKLKEGLQWVIDHKGEIVAALGAMAAGVGAYVAYTTALNIMKNGFMALSVAQKAAAAGQAILNAVMALNPVGLVIAAVVALVAAFVLLWNKCEGFRNFWIGLWDKITSISSKAWQSFKEGASKAWEGVKNVFSKVGQFFSDTFSTAWQKVKDVFSKGGQVFSGIKEGIESAFKAIVNVLIRGINKVVKIPFDKINDMLQRIKNVEIMGLSPFKNLISTFKVPQIPELAKGGVVRGATNAIIGEDGAEAIVPLERNTEWLDKVADRIAEKSGGVTINQTNNYSQAHSRYEIYKSRKEIENAVRFARVGV